jgi:hypothetical protein
MIRIAVLIALFCSLAGIETARADERIKLNVRVSHAPEGVAARFEIERDVSNLRLEYRSELAEGTWSISTPGLTYKNGEISGDAPFRAFDVVVAARNDLSGPFYPCVVKIGDSGRIVYASYFAGQQATFDTTITFAAQEGAAVVGLPRGGQTLRVERTAVADDQAASIYVYMGSLASVREMPLATFVADPTAPVWIQEQIENLAGPSLAFYRRSTGISLRRKPLIMTTFTPGRSGAFQADVTEGPNVAFRIFGDQWLTKSDRAMADVRHTARHEYAHFWNSHAFRSSDNERARWLHEGGAEYWARVAEADHDHRDRLSRNVESALNRCAQLLDATPLSQARDNEAYPCGETIHWVADLGQRQNGKDHFALWRELFKRADANGGSYSAAMFRDLAEQSAPAVRSAISIILDHDGTGRWHELPVILGKLGAKVETLPPTPEQFRNAAVMQVLKPLCEGSYGFWTEDSWLKLDTGDRCGPFSGDQEVDSVNGYNLFKEPKAAFEAVEAACKTNGDVAFSRTGVERTWTAKCARPLHHAPPNFRIKQD